jgi:hypothetical protein
MKPIGINIVRFGVYLPKATNRFIDGLLDETRSLCWRL